jgi:hypothetical protein
MSAAKQTLENRVATLEAEVSSLKARLEGKPAEDWVKAISGTFANDPLYDEAMRLGRKWRESFQPKTKVKKRRKR